MTFASRISTTLGLCFFTLIATPCSGDISVGVLKKKAANNEYGITMHACKNGDAGTKVWLQFKKEGWLEKFTYAELQMKDSRGKTHHLG